MFCIDHIVELATGGASSLANGRVISQAANTGKQDLNPARPNRGNQKLTAFNPITFREYRRSTWVNNNYNNGVPANNGITVALTGGSHQLNKGDEVNASLAGDLEVSRGGSTNYNNIVKKETIGYHNMGTAIMQDRSDHDRYVSVAG